MGQWGPGGPVVLVISISRFAPEYRWVVVYFVFVYVFEGCFLDLRLLRLCLGFGPAVLYMCIC